MVSRIVRLTHVEREGRSLELTGRRLHLHWASRAPFRRLSMTLLNDYTEFFLCQTRDAVQHQTPDYFRLRFLSNTR